MFGSQRRAEEQQSISYVFLMPVSFPLQIHGDKEQQERDWVLNQFRSDACTVLVATDVASRGLDVNNIMYVINFDMPGQVLVVPIVIIA